MIQQQSNKINFNGQNIYVGIDVHLKSWSVTILTESGFKKRHNQPSSAQSLYEHLKRHYPGGRYLAVYESGFCGFSVYYALQEFGIDCMVVHAADVPTTQYESVMKTDPIDSDKLAKALKGGLLKGIHIRRKENLDDLSLMRLRKKIQRQLGGYKSQVKHLLYCHGVVYPERFAKSGTHWSGAFMKWLREEVVLLSQTRRSLDNLLEVVDFFRNRLLALTGQVRTLSKSSRYGDVYNRLASIPGLGMITAMCLLTEIDDINRFRNERQFASYLGLVPCSHCSGEKVTKGEKTFRGNKQIGPMLVESAWVSIRHDKVMAAAYSGYCSRMEPQEAIIRIARKLANRILSVWKNEKQYEYDKCR